MDLPTGSSILESDGAVGDPTAPNVLLQTMESVRWPWNKHMTLAPSPQFWQASGKHEMWWGSAVPHAREEGRRQTQGVCSVHCRVAPDGPLCVFMQNASRMPW